MLDNIRKLRERTSVSLNKCKLALEAVNGDLEQAVIYLQKQGLADAAKKADKQADEGIIHSYIHMDKIGVMAQINCQTDFAARSEELKEFANVVVMQIAAMNPLYVSKDTVPQSDLEQQLEIAREQVKDAIKNKPEDVINKIIAGKLDKWYSDVCLLNQQSIADSTKTIERLRAELVAKLGENVVIKRFVRWELGRA